MDPHADADIPDGRDESPNERLDRNWAGLLQELRVLQTGTQLLIGFLLTIAFVPVFRQLAAWQKTLYLVVVCLAVFSTVLVLMPVALHRVLFRRQAMGDLVHWADRMVRAGLAATGLAIAGVLALVFSTVTGVVGAAIAGGAVLAAVLVLWTALPLALRRGRPHLPAGRGGQRDA